MQETRERQGSRRPRPWPQTVPRLRSPHVRQGRPPLPRSRRVRATLADHALADGLVAQPRQALRAALRLEVGRLAPAARVDVALAVLLGARLRRLAHLAMRIRRARELPMLELAICCLGHGLHLRALATATNDLVHAPLLGVPLRLEARVAAIDEQRPFARRLAIVNDLLCQGHEVLLRVAAAGALLVALAPHHLRLGIDLAIFGLHVPHQCLPMRRHFALLLDALR
mmetsp:Transcript_48910/g.113708  ORF Transcript_48910/g.113708 Transcript_48910/m.113708 type:complete len:227 (-) Transcript_48910:395-1075(-)